MVRIFLISFVGVFLYIFSGVCFLAAVLGFLMNICTGPEAVKMLTTGFVAFVLPFASGWLIEKIAVLKSFCGILLNPDADKQRGIQLAQI